MALQEREKGLMAPAPKMGEVTCVEMKRVGRGSEGETSARFVVLKKN
jgi:hypothetical protein